MIFRLFIISFLILTGCTKKTETQQNTNQVSQLQVEGSGDFQVVPYGEIKVKTFIFKNNTSTTETLNPQITGPQAADFIIGYTLGCQTVDPGKSCLIKVLFNTQGKTSGQYQAQLSVGDTISNLSAEIETVPQVSYQFVVNNVVTNALDLGVLEGSHVKLLTVKIKNNSPKMGNASTLSVSNPRIKILTSTCSNAALKPNQSCTAKIWIKGENTDSTISGDLIFDNHTLAISGTEQHQNLPSNLVPFESSVTLGDVFEEDSKKIQLISLQNTGSGIGSVENITLPPEFTIASNNCLSVKPGKNCVIRIVYTASEIVKGQSTSTIDLGDSELDVVINQVSKPNSLATIILNTADNSLINTCVALEVSVKDQEGLSFVSSKNIDLASSQTLFSDSSCTNSVSATLSPYESEKTFYIKDGSVGDKTLTLSKDSVSVNKNVFFYEELTVNSSINNVITNQVSTVSYVGGKAPHSFEKISGVGVISNTGVFQSDVPGDTQIKITDSIGNEAIVNYHVVLPLAASINSFEKIVNQTQTIQGQYGLPPYSYSKVSGVGSVNETTGEFTAGSVAGLVSLKIIDSLDQEVIVSGEVFNLLTVNLNTVTIALSNSHTITPAGGKTPYSYSKISGVGTVSSGLFSSLNTGNSQIKVSDALGQEVMVNITVNSDITVSAGTCVSTNPEQVDCTVSVTGGVGSKTFTTDKGQINPTTGVFYGQCQNNLGQSTITATDSMGNTGSVTVSYPCVYKTCSQLRAEGFGLVSGDYWIDPDGIARAGSSSPFKVYCDFRTTGTFALMAEKKAADGIYFPTSLQHGGHALGFYNYGPSANGTFSKDLKSFSSIPMGMIRLEDGIYHYAMTWDGLNEFKYQTSANLSTNPPGKIWSLNNTGFVAPAFNTSLGGYGMRELNTGATEDQCGMMERNGTNPHAGINKFYFISLNPASGWNTNGSQNWCPYGLGAHGDYNYDGYAWLGGYRTGSGTAIKVYYQDVYYFRPRTCQEAKERGTKNLAGNTGNGTYVLDTDGYLYGAAEFNANCDMETSQYGYQEVSTGNLNTSKMLQGKQFVKIGSYISTTGVNSGTQVIGLFGPANISNNYLVGKPNLFTTNNYVTHSTPVRGYNYMGGHKWFFNNGIDAGNLNYAIVFSNGVVGSVWTASDGTSVGSEHAYVYYYRHNYTLWERP